MTTKDKHTGTTITNLYALVNRHFFNCDACTRETYVEYVVTSTLLPESRFCSSDCREDAEVAAENARDNS